MEFNLDTTIKELFEHSIISVRTFNCLNTAGYETLGIILDNIETPVDLIKLPKFGRKSYTEVDEILNQMIREHKAVVPGQKEARFAALGETIIGIITDAYKVVTAGDTEVKAYLQAAHPQPCDMHELVMGDLDNMLVVVEEYTLNENLEIRHSYKEFIELVLNKMEYAQEAENAIYVEYKRKSMNLAIKMENFSYEQISKYFLSPIARDYLEKSYQTQLKSSLSVRSKNFAAKFIPHFDDLIKYADEPLASYRNICPGQSMMKTLTEIFQFNQKFKREFDRVSKLSDDEIQTEFLKRDYPFLMNRQRQFVFDFMKEHNHAPLFFLLYHYLRLSENKSDKIYCLANGIFDGRSRTLTEIAEVMNLSRERVRQIVDKKKVRARTDKNLTREGIEAQEIPILNDEGWDSYNDFLEKPFIYERTEEYVKLKEFEHLPIDFEVFASLVMLVADFKAEDVEGHTILMNNKYSDLKLIDCLNTLFSIIDAKYSADTYVPIECVLFTVPELLRPAMKELVKHITTELYKVKITEDEKLYLPQNYIDIAEELYDILDKKGEPMHVEDIFKEFKTRYPDHKFTDPLQIKSYLFKHKHIKAVGKTSCYALDSWEGVYFGSIRDLLVDLLSDSDLPLHIDNLYEGVAEHYPNTTKASVAATMEDENLQRFIEFEGGYFGLTSKDYPAEYVPATSVQRYRFEDRFRMFKGFIETYRRFPSYNGGDKEASLMRWYYNVTTGVLSMADEQKAMLYDTLKRYDELGIPRSATESEFLLKCQEVKDFIRQHHTLPTNREAPELYAWLRRSRDNYDSYIDKRRQYMTDLLNYVLSFGFSI